VFSEGWVIEHAVAVEVLRLEVRAHNRHFVLTLRVLDHPPATALRESRSTVGHFHRRDRAHEVAVGNRLVQSRVVGQQPLGHVFDRLGARRLRFGVVFEEPLLGEIGATCAQILRLVDHAALPLGVLWIHAVQVVLHPLLQDPGLDSLVESRLEVLFDVASERHVLRRQVARVPVGLLTVLGHHGLELPEQGVIPAGVHPTGNRVPRCLFGIALDQVLRRPGCIVLAAGVSVLPLANVSLPVGELGRFPNHLMKRLGSVQTGQQTPTRTVLDLLHPAGQVEGLTHPLGRRLTWLGFRYCQAQLLQLGRKVEIGGDRRARPGLHCPLWLGLYSRGRLWLCRGLHLGVLTAEHAVEHFPDLRSQFVLQFGALDRFVDLG